LFADHGGKKFTRSHFVDESLGPFKQEKSQIVDVGMM
jgi:hypothetical protein